MPKAKLQITSVKIETLKYDPDNSRDHTPRNLRAIAASLKKWGQVLPLLVQKQERYIIGGNGTLRAMRALKFAEVDIIETDKKGKEARELAAALNRTAELATWNDKIADVLRGQYLDDDLKDHGWDGRDLAKLIGGADDLPTFEDEIDVLSLDEASDLLGDGLDRDGLEQLAGYRTSKDRKTKSAPMTFYEKFGQLKGKVLDYGSGRDPHKFARYDPAFSPDLDPLYEVYDVVTCNYVLNVLPLVGQRVDVLLAIRGLLSHPNGIALVSVWGKDHESVSKAGYQCGWSVDEWETLFSALFGKVVKLDSGAFHAWKLLSS